MIRTYKYRLSPTKQQQHLLAALFDQMQTVYNDALNERRWCWRRNRRSVTYYDQWNRIRDERHRLPDEMGMLNATSIQQMLRRVDKAHQAFYKGQAWRTPLQGPPPLQECRIPPRRRLQAGGRKTVRAACGQCPRQAAPSDPRWCGDQAGGDQTQRRASGTSASNWSFPTLRRSGTIGPAVGIDVGLHSLLGPVGWQPD